MGDSLSYLDNLLLRFKDRTKPLQSPGINASALKNKIRTFQSALRSKNVLMKAQIHYFLAFIRILFIRTSRLKFTNFLEHCKNKPLVGIWKRIIICSDLFCVLHGKL